MEEHKGLVDGLQDELNRRRERSEALKHLIEQKRSSGGSPDTQKAKTKLQELSSSFRAEVVSSSISSVVCMSILCAYKMSYLPACTP